MTCAAKGTEGVTLALCPPLSKAENRRLSDAAPFLRLFREHWPL